MILQLAAQNPHGRGHTFTDIKSLRSFVKSTLDHPAGPAVLENAVVILPAEAAEFALNSLPITPATVIIHGEGAQEVGKTLRALGTMTVIAL